MPAIKKTTAVRSTKTVAAKKPVAKKAPAKKVAAKKGKPASLASVRTRTAAELRTIAKAKAARIAELQAGQKPQRTKLTRVELFDKLAFENSMTRKQVKEFFDSLSTVVMSCMMPKGCGEFTIPGLTTFVARDIPAKKGGQKVMSFGVERISKPKPKTRRVRARLATQIKQVALPVLH